MKPRSRMTFFQPTKGWQRWHPGSWLRCLQLRRKRPRNLLGWWGEWLERLRCWPGRAETWEQRGEACYRGTTSKSLTPCLRLTSTHLKWSWNKSHLTRGCVYSVLRTFSGTKMDNAMFFDNLVISFWSLSAFSCILRSANWSKLHCSSILQLTVKGTNNYLFF